VSPVTTGAIRLNNSNMPKNRGFTVIAKIHELNYCRKRNGGYLVICSSSKGKEI